MMSSKSRASISRWLQVAAVLLLGWYALIPSIAEADRKRVVVLELEGPKAERFQKDLVKVIKKSHSVVPLSKWNRTADQLGASKPTTANIKKVAKKLKIDAVISGEVTKRRDEYILKLKLRSGSSGELVGNGFETKAEGPRLDGSAKRDVKDELVALIDEMKANRFTGGSDDEDEEDEEEEDRPKRLAKKDKAKERKAKKSRDADEDEEEEADEEEERPRKRGFARKSKADRDDDEEDEDDEERSGRKVASRDDDEGDDEDEEGIEDEAEIGGLAGAEALRPGERAVDFTLGLSFNARRMTFSHEANLGNRPPPYKGVPVAGALIDATMYPLAIGHKRRGMAKNLGVTVMYDKVLKINSEQGDVVYPTTQARWAIGAAFRYPVGKITLGATLRYGKQNFTIQQVAGQNPVDTPNVSYSMFEPMATLRYEATPKIVLNANLGILAIQDTGPIQSMEQYGPASVLGVDLDVGGDYLLTKNLFARAALRFETIGYSFSGGAAKSNMRDADAEQDVFGARDSYFGGAISLGYLY